MKNSLVEKINQASTEPGVYLLKDSKGQVIYIGKARVLRDRLRAYLGWQNNPRLAALIRRTSEIETIVTRSEVEALLLEESLIKIKKPRYNVRLRDDKKYPYLKITVNEQFPRIFVTRNIKPDGSIIFGPYTSARELRRAVRAVKRVFKIRTCKRTLPNSNGLAPCLNFQMKRCLAPCAGLVNPEEYRQRVKDVIEFLSGRNEKLTAELERRMWAEAEHQRYEEAGILRDQLLALREIVRNQQVVTQKKVNQDVVGISRGEKTAAVVLFRVREGKIVAREEYFLNAPGEAPAGELLEGFVRSIYIHTADLPDEIVLPAPIADGRLFEHLFWEKRRRKVVITVPQRGEKRKLVELAERNAEKALVESVSSEERIPEGTRELARLLGLPVPPRLIEGVDISNTQGSNAVGSVVVFRDARPLKSQYRLFKIRTVTGPNDFAMIEEVLARRVRGLLEKNLPLPDLVLVDGGIGQLSAALKAYHQFDQEIPILGLAKRTDTLFYIDGRKVTIPATSAALKLLKRIRDESHRFAITFHRKLRGKKQVESELDTIPGVGAERRRGLIHHFGSIARIRGAGIEELARVKGIGKGIAEKIYQFFHPQS